MRIDCVSCGYEINLDHRVFDDYAGPIKCYCCGAMMEVRTQRGVMHSLMRLENHGPGIGEEGREAAAV